MATATRNGVLAMIVAVLLLLSGVAVAFGVDASLAANGTPDAVPVPGLADPTLVWMARVLLVLSVAWVVIGMVAARTRLVRRPGAAGARAAWLASTRPWRARESTLGMLPLDRWLMILVPGALLVATRAVQTALLGWVDLVVALGGWLVFATVVRLLIRQRSPWPVIAAVGGVVVLRCVLALVAVSIGGPAAFWSEFWTDAAARWAYLVPSVALAVWAFVAAVWALVAQFGRRQAWGMVLAGLGAGLAVPSAVIGIAGMRAVADAWSGQLPGIRPDVAAVLGDASGAWWAVAVGVLMLVVGLALRLVRPRDADPASPWR